MKISIKKIRKIQKKIVDRNFKRAARKGLEKIKKVEKNHDHDTN